MREALIVNIEQPPTNDVTALVESRAALRRHAQNMPTRDLQAAPRRWYLEGARVIAFIHAALTAGATPGADGSVDFTATVDAREFHAIAFADGRLMVAVNDKPVIDSRVAGKEVFWPDEWLVIFLGAIERAQLDRELQFAQREIAAHSEAVAIVTERL